MKSLMSFWFFHCSEAATGGVLLEKVFLEISQKSQENACARVSFLITLQAETFFTEYLSATGSDFPHWTDFPHCSGVFIVNFEQVNAG